MKCCSTCFNDTILKNEISLHGELGKCDFCKTENVKTISPDFLNNYFSVLFSIYIPSDEDSAESINRIINDDWNIISNKVSNPIDLLSKIIDQEVVTKYKRPELNDDHMQTWNEFREEIVYKNRFFPSAIPQNKKLINLFSYLTFEILPSFRFYRCRIQNDDSIYDKLNMGKPPAKKVKNGRVNPIGISYLYLASEKEIAIHEVRPHIGHRVSIAEFNVIENITVIDLRNPEATLSPFTFDEDDLLSLYTDLPYIKMLSSELSSPVIPDETDTEYLPSQYLCELIKVAGFDGVIYNSSMAIENGYNLALFDDDKIDIQDEIKSLQISSNLLQWEYM